MPRINSTGATHLQHANPATSATDAEVFAPCQKMDAIALVTVGLFACGFMLYVPFQWGRDKATRDRVFAEMVVRLNQRIKKTEANQC